MPAHLLALNDGPSILLDKPILLLGRDSECDIRLDSRKISRRHCCLALIGERLVVRDLGSTNGVRVNGVRVLEGCLQGGDELTIGNYRYQVRFDAVVPVGVGKAEKRVVPQGPTDQPPPQDLILEESDEPVPLSDVDEKAPQAKAAAARPTELAADEPPRPETKPPANPAAQTSYQPLLPDDLDLAPASDPNRPSPPAP